MTRRNVALAKFLNTGITNTSLSEDRVIQVIDSDYITDIIGGAVDKYDTVGLVPSVGPVGALGYIDDSDVLIIGTGEGWLEIVSANATPFITTTLDASYPLGLQDSLDFSISAGDSDGIPLTYSYSLDPLVDSSILYVTQDSSQFKVITGDSDGSTDITFTVSDGINIASISTTLNVSGSTVTGVTGTYTQTTVGSDTVYTFTGNGTITLGFSASAWILVVGGGGGGGGSYYSGGGGAGAFYQDTNITIPAGTHTITVGDGQLGGAINDITGSGRGGTSSIVGTGINVQAYGGARAGGYNGAGAAGTGTGKSGSSGGGGGGANAAGGSGSGDGNNGGAGTSPNGGGGGGAGGAGTTPTSSNYSSNTSNGGAGLSSTITGSSQFYAAGGGGFYFSGQSSYGTRASGIGGKSSGGYNTLTADLTELSGLANTGSGGGGADRRQPGYSRAGDGGSGIVVIRVLG